MGQNKFTQAIFGVGFIQFGEERFGYLFSWTGSLFFRPPPPAGHVGVTVSFAGSYGRTVNSLLKTLGE
jgi:hypothetical protein